MRTIFISPLLWQRLNRAVRRREEGQALVLIALVAVALIAIVGLAVDSGMAFLEAQRLQRAADNAALTGVVWVPDKKDVADYRGRFAVQTSGYKVYDQTSTNGTQDTSNYNSVDKVNAGKPGDVTFYQSNNPPPLPTQYRVTLTTKVQTYFMGVLGFGSFTITRTALAEYATPARLGGSFNYFGSSSLPYDPYIPAMASQGDSYYKTLFDRYFASNCQKEPNAPAPDATKPCVGTFWLSIQGPHGMHGNGDAYTALGDGATGTNSGGAFTGGVTVNTNSSAGVGGCAPSAGPVDWFFNLTGACSTALSTTSPVPQLNQDIHPDSNGRRGFGYEIAVEVDGKALRDDGTVNGNNTRLNIYIYDAAQADKASDSNKDPNLNGGQPNAENFNTGDSYSCYTNGSCSGSFTQSKSPLDKLAFDASKAAANGSTTQQRTLINFTSPSDVSQFKANGTDYLNKPTDNGGMTRFSLYFPPAAKGIPTTFATKGDLIATLVTSDASTRRGGFNYAAPVAGIANSYCYIATPNSSPGTKDQFSYANGEPSTVALNLQVVYTCPPLTTPYDPTKTDWEFQQAMNALRGKNYATPYPTSGVSGVIPDVNSQCPNDAYGKLGLSCGTPQTTDAPYKYLDPEQECRSYFDPLAYGSATDFTTNGTITQVGSTPRKPPIQTGSPINERLPFNMRGLEPSLGRVTSSLNLKNISYHGWRCSWDFDSSQIPFMNRGGNPTSQNTSNGDNGWFDDVNLARKNNVDGVLAEPFFHLSNYGYLAAGGAKQRISYVNGTRVAGGATPNVREGVYLLHVQTYGGQFANRYAVKAEYENPQPIAYNYVDVDGTVKQNIINNPVPQVYGIGAMCIFANSVNTTGTALNVIFDLAYIPRQNAGVTAVLELWDPGDVQTGLQIQVLEPSGFGQYLNAGSVPVGKPITIRPTACPMYKGNQCVVGSAANFVEAKPPSAGSWFNDQWLLLSFQVPSSAAYDNYDKTCGVLKIPTTLCYYFQINYKMTSNGSGNDTTTWALTIANQPVRLAQ